MNQVKRIQEADATLEFSKDTIENAIYTEDGLDGAEGEYTLKIILDYYKKYRPDLYKEHQKMKEGISKQPLL